jgi:hypothetical protein
MLFPIFQGYEDSNAQQKPDSYSKQSWFEPLEDGHEIDRLQEELMREGLNERHFELLTIRVLIEFFLVRFGLVEAEEWSSDFETATGYVMLDRIPHFQHEPAETRWCPYPGVWPGDLVVVKHGEAGYLYRIKHIHVNGRFILERLGVRDRPEQRQTCARDLQVIIFFGSSMLNYPDLLEFVKAKGNAPHYAYEWFYQNPWKHWENEAYDQRKKVRVSRWHEKWTEEEKAFYEDYLKKKYGDFRNPKV